jgi:predicted metal-binding membrane protein
MVDKLLARDRVLIGAGIACLTALAWWYTVREADAMMGPHAGMDMSDVMMTAWTRHDALVMFLMWTIMMVAMMTPSIAPSVLLVATHARAQRERSRPYAPAGAFLAGYLAVWTLFSAAATLAQWTLQAAALVNMMMEPASRVFAGGVFLAAGIFQWTPWKHACLRHCRSPLHVFLHDFRPGTRAALLMGFRHGAYCTGCCWILMALLFAVGVMNLVWVAGLSVFVLLEKLAPRGEWTARLGGVLLAAAGLWRIFSDRWN